MMFFFSLFMFFVLILAVVMIIKTDRTGERFSPVTLSRILTVRLSIFSRERERERGERERERERDPSSDPSYWCFMRDPSYWCFMTNNNNYLRRQWKGGAFDFLELGLIGEYFCCKNAGSAKGYHYLLEVTILFFC